MSNFVTGPAIAWLVLTPAAALAAAGPAPDASNLIFEFITLPAAALLIAGSPLWRIVGKWLRDEFAKRLTERKTSARHALASGTRL